MRTLAVLLAAAILVVPFAVAEEPEKKAEEQPAADKVDVKALLKAFGAAMKANRRDAPARLAEVQKLVAVVDPAVGKALLKTLSDRDPEVRAAAARALAHQADGKNDKTYGKALAGRLKKWDDDDPKAIEGILDGLVAFPNKGNIKTLTKMVEKVMYKEDKAWQPVGQAAVRALGAIREKDAIEQLIKLLGMTNPRAGSGGTSPSAETVAFRGSFKTDIVGGLQNITGNQVKDPGVWQAWWSDSGKTYKVPKKGAEEELNKEMWFQDSFYKFKVKRPNAEWTFVRPTIANYVIECGHPMVGNPTQTDVSLTVECYSQTEYSGSTPGERVQYWNNWAEDETRGFTDLKEQWEKDATVAGVRAKHWHAKGMTVKRTVKTMDKYIFVKDARLWTVHLTMGSGVPEELQKQLQKAFGSFGFMK